MKRNISSVKASCVVSSPGTVQSNHVYFRRNASSSDAAASTMSVLMIVFVCGDERERGIEAKIKRLGSNEPSRDVVLEV